MSEPTSDPNRTPGRRPVRLAVPAALFLVFAGMVYVFASRLPQRPAPEVSPENAPPTAEIDDPVGRALAMAGLDSTRREEWVAEIPDFDLSGLSPARRDLFVRLANTEHCTCGCGFTLAACRAFDPTCEDSGPRVAELRDSVAAGAYDGATGLREPPAR